ncbi:acetate--CoA ligase family protein [Paracoccus pantotrophus]|uniref:acetate--CoA ligase family protein n=1 Tax=Paracoccus pantotrophus TaxID=82367 RepID=UPI0004B79613|nr:acetate--CoA ligase family protein [Paracoccus pantotrophus]
MKALNPANHPAPSLGESDLRALVEPRRIAVIGASPKEGAFGNRLLTNLLDQSGTPVDLVNGRYDRIGDAPCYPGIAALPEVPDLAILATAQSAVEEVLVECAEAGVRGALLFAAGYAETGRPDRIAAQQRLTALARRTGMRIVGPNCIGLYNFRRDLRMTFTVQEPLEQPGSHAIGLVSQSGALGAAVSAARYRGVSFSHMLSVGNACDVDVADWISYLAGDEDCRVIACILEGLNAPWRFRAAALQARRAGKPLVVCRMGKSEAGGEAAASHTGAIAGSAAGYEALFHDVGAIETDRFEALLEISQYLAKAGRPRARGVGVVSTSGGAAVLAADKAFLHGVDLPQPAAETQAELEAAIPDFGVARNPCDVTAQVVTDPASLRRASLAMLHDPGYGAMVFPYAHAAERARWRIPALSEAAATAGKPIALVWISGWLEGPGARDAVRDPRIGFFSSMDSCFEAIAAWHRWHLDKPEAAEAPPPEPAAVEAAKAILETAGPALTEREAAGLVAAFGLSTTRSVLATSAEEAVQVAAGIGVPVALKVESPDIAHKTEAGGVALSLVGADAVREGFGRILRTVKGRLPQARIAGVLVQRMAPKGVEILVGGRVDPVFGPLVTLAVGGVFVELLKDSVTRLAPVNHGTALGMIAALRSQSLLDGFRDLPAIDRAALADTVCRFSQMLAALRDDIAEAEVNPLICAGGDIVAVDALVRRPAAVPGQAPPAAGS